MALVKPVVWVCEVVLVHGVVLERVAALLLAVLERVVALLPAVLECVAALLPVVLARVVVV